MKRRVSNPVIAARRARMEAMRREGIKASVRTEEQSRLKAARENFTMRSFKKEPAHADQ